MTRSRQHPAPLRRQRPSRGRRATAGAGPAGGCRPLPAAGLRRHDGRRRGGGRGVSPETVYKAYGGKAGLVHALRDQALQGAGPVSAESRSDALRALTDPRAVIAGWARLATEVAPRVTPVLLLVRDASAGDPTMREVHDEMEVARWERMTDNARHLAEGGHLRTGVDCGTAADVMFAVSAPEMFEMLVLRRGWSLERYASYVEATLVAALLPSPDRTSWCAARPGGRCRHRSRPAPRRSSRSRARSRPSGRSSPPSACRRRRSRPPAASPGCPRRRA